MSQQHLLLDFCPQPLQNKAMGRPIIQVESHNMRTDRTYFLAILTFLVKRCVYFIMYFDDNEWGHKARENEMSGTVVEVHE